jgi:hypothetical protein
MTITFKLWVSWTCIPALGISTEVLTFKSNGESASRGQFYGEERKSTDDYRYEYALTVILFMNYRFQYEIHR